MADVAPDSVRASSFGAAAEAYDAYRPAYPDAVVDWLLPGAPRTVLDLGAGTGKLTDSLVARGLDVIAIEPDASMLALLRSRHPEVCAMQGAAEQIDLLNASVDTVVIGQAWHWMDADRASAEIARVLRPGGTLAAAWNEEDPSRASWLPEFDSLDLAPRGRLVDARFPVSPFEPVEELRHTWTRSVRVADYLGEQRSRSSWITATPAQRDERIGHWNHLLATHADLVGRGVLEIPYLTYAWRTRAA